MVQNQQGFSKGGKFYKGNLHCHSTNSDGAGTPEERIEEYRAAAVAAVKQLSLDVGIPADLKEIVKVEDVPFLAQSAYDDACRPGNPRATSVEEISALYMSLL